ncbi:putative B3 domain-containing protein Os03g0621600 [Coffea arabica]|uniref:B3 domain-containing protein Os03g0621600 n=2 Tax=Coffea TaxID=13442 RepID=A0A6P6SJT6_COFAR|nr:B3 domain-containing protein REM21-like [Coffea arabica]XP_027125313.1 B3 domain-containing protein REM21-like [Coffea arabica]
MKQNSKVLYSDESPMFFKVYTDQLCSSQLKIPPEFVKKFNGDVPQTFTLEGPQGRSWQIVAGKVDEYFYFQEGWQNFVEDNSLENDDFLTFSYGGCSRFYVEIFGKHGCRKEGAFTIWNDAMHRNENAVEQLHGKLNNTTQPMGRSLRSRTRGSCSEIGLAGKVQDNMRHHSGPFRVQLTKTYTNRYVKFPRDFGNVKKHWKKGKGALLRVQAREWKVSIAKSGRYFHLCTGWSSFVKENSLKIGDECNFEVIDNNDDGIVLEVTMSRCPDKIE